MPLPRNQAEADAHNARVAAGRSAKSGPLRAPAPATGALTPAGPADTPLKRHSASQTTEEDVAQAILEEIRRRGWVCFRSKPTERTGRAPGEPDLEVWADRGRTFHVELKRPVGGKLSTEQLGVIAWAAKLGHQVHVARSLEDFLGIVDGTLFQRDELLHRRD